MEQILSQDEVDALLKGISGGEIEEPEEEVEEEGKEYKPYDFTRQERIAPVKMPALDVINDSFLRAIRSSLSGLLRQILDITAAPMELERFGAFVRTLPVPSSLQIFKMDPFRGQAMCIVEPKLVFTFVENFLGGSGRRTARIEGRDFTSIEQRLIQRVVNLLLADLEKAWNNLQPVTVQFVRSEINPQFAKICEPEDVVIINRYDIDMDQASGSITTCIPLNNLESVKQKLMTSVQREQSEEDIRLQQTIKENVRNLPLEIKVELGKSTLSIGNILNLTEGDIIQLDKRQDENLPVYLENRKKFTGTPGNYRGNKAIRIQHKILDPNKE
ncbi:MAG: flagellar motor switch protein FliM [Desulfurivibrionaceae bacterium]